MKNYIKYIIGVVVVLAIVGGYFYPKVKGNFSGTNNAAGTTFGTAKVAQVNIALSSVGANGTSTSILNTDSTDRIIQDFYADCNTVGSSVLTGFPAMAFTAATSSTASPNALSNANVFTMPIATSSPDAYNITGTATTSTLAFNRVWGTNTYLTFVSNATNTAVCTVGVHYFGF